MGETSARDRLAEELRKLKTDSGLTYTRIENQARKQNLRLTRSKLSNWFTGTNVPEADASFTLLVQLLEKHAHARSGVARRGLQWWSALQKKAAAERDATGAPKPAARTAPPATPSEAAPHSGDVDKAARLLSRLPLDGYWLRWLQDAQTMLKVPLIVSDPLCDAHRPLETDRPAYVDPELQAAHQELVAALGALTYELNGMNDISDEGQDVLELSNPGTTAARNALHRQVCQARDSFLLAYDRMINLLNRKNLLSPAPKSPLDITVDLLAARWAHEGVLAAPLAAGALLPSRDPTAPYYFAVDVASRNDQGPQIAAVGIEMVKPDGTLAASYRFPARGPGHRPRLPFQLTAYGAGQALANGPEVAVSLQALRGAVARVRPFAHTGSGQIFHGEWRTMAEMQPFLGTVLPPPPAS
ncbi:hypothetical protein AQF52_0018 [Streptomyces venezuelae]|uniref:hypothetical protein n=1 Tax=Streptomyces gardneri TaxID=66892 RepID=UPI0006BD80ED|nr:hypothetical protein [Streptomyces gardneri]ALO05620.1 hypothetical protein AQF52_0018 [Streptomyces venezuelae]QPK43217.1 hypothetical protein H4W23_00080 [Streptomyces gardneri]CUM35547.1 hypothetical protein BN2537_59 [Streptomyces venezuelae]